MRHLDTDQLFTCFKNDSTQLTQRQQCPSSFLSDFDASSQFMISLKASSTIIEDNDVTLVPVQLSSHHQQLKKQINEISIDRTLKVDSSVHPKLSKSHKKLDHETLELIDLFNSQARKSTSSKPQGNTTRDSSLASSVESSSGGKRKLVYDLVVKQQEVVKKLNQENQRVIQENVQLKQELTALKSASKVDPKTKE